MTTIWKLPLETVDKQMILIPLNSKILCVQVQGLIPCLWVQIHPDNSRETRTIFTFGTGHPIPPSSGEYVGTYQLESGALVFHVFAL